MALGMVLWNKRGIVLSADIKGTFPCREFNKEDMFQELELGKDVYKYYVYDDKYVIIHPGLIEGNPIGLDIFEEENNHLGLTDMVMSLASWLESRVLPKRKYDYFVAGYVDKNQYIYHIEVSDKGVTVTCKLNSEPNVMLLGGKDTATNTLFTTFIARNILSTAFSVVELKDMTINEMMEISKQVYSVSSDLQDSLSCVNTIGKECNVLSITPEGLRHKFFDK